MFSASWRWHDGPLTILLHADECDRGLVTADGSTEQERQIVSGEIDNAYVNMSAE